MTATCRRPATSTQQSGSLASRFWAESSRGMEIDANGRWPHNCGVGFHDDPARLSPPRNGIGQRCQRGNGNQVWLLENSFEMFCKSYIATSVKH